MIFGLHFGAPEQKIEEFRISSCFSVQRALWIILGPLWSPFWSHFGILLGAWAPLFSPKGLRQPPDVPNCSPIFPSGASRCCRGAMLRSFDGFRHTLRDVQASKIAPELSKITLKWFQTERVFHRLPLSGYLQNHSRMVPNIRGLPQIGAEIGQKKHAGTPPCIRVLFVVVFVCFLAESREKLK